jgi:hypothetical protein
MISAEIMMAIADNPEDLNFINFQATSISPITVFPTAILVANKVGRVAAVLINKASDGNLFSKPDFDK